MGRHLLGVFAIAEVLVQVPELPPRLLIVI